MTMDYGVKNVFIHAFGDGRDTDPRSGIGYMKSLLDHLKKSNGGLHHSSEDTMPWTAIRDGKELKEAYDLIVNGIGSPTENIIDAMQESYDNEVTDEFIKPIVVVDK